MNRNLLRGRIAEKGLTQQELANKIGISNNSLSRKMLGKRQFALGEVIRICDVLEIENPKEIFFGK
ncbi:MAG: helix-turn-helix transcriptional regulator [Anaerovoracaceae bacterium]